jgi:cbb3-type cytochrome oxidase subunit 3
VTVWPIITAEPWTPASVIGALVLLAVVIGVVWWGYNRRRS